MRKTPSKIVAVINGKPTAGKDELIKRCRIVIKDHDIPLHIHNVSSVDGVKEAAKILGWNGVKDDDSRNALSDLKVLSEKVWNGPNKYMQKYIEDIPEQVLPEYTDIVFLHVREIENINAIVKICTEIEVPVTTIYVDRDVEVTAKNIGDANTLSPDFYEYQHVISNDGTKMDLLFKAESLLDSFNDNFKQQYILTTSELSEINREIQHYFDLFI